MLVATLAGPAAFGSRVWAEPRPFSASARVGLEHDDNIGRAEDDRAQADFLTRYFATLDTSHGVGTSARLAAGLRLGGKRFFEQRDADSLLTQIDLSYSQRLATFATAGAFAVSAEADLKDLSERLSRRDYNRGGGRLAGVLSLGDLRLSLGGAWRYFAFKPRPNSSSHGPQFDLGARYFVGDHVVLDASYVLARRLSDSPVLVLEPPHDIVSLSTRPRRDTFHAARAGVGYRGPLYADLHYTLAINTSNSYGQQLLRHSVDVMVTAPLVWQTLVSLRGELQRTTYTDPVLVDEQFVVDEENRNALIVSLARPLVGDWEVELRYSLYLQEFGVGGQYSRQTFLVALGYLFE